MGSKGGGGSSQPSGNTTTTQTNTPWGGQQPYLQDVMAHASDLYNQSLPGGQGGPQYFPDSTVAQFTPGQSGGLNNLVNFGLQGGSSSVGAANGALTNIENGNMLSAGNPYFGGMVKSISDAVAPQVNAQFAANGRAGSGANQQAFDSTLTNAVAPLAFQNYTSGLNNIVQGAGLAPVVQAGQTAGLQTAVDAGGQQQGQNQANINDQINRFNFQQQKPQNMLANYAQMIQGNYGGTSTLTQPYFAQQSGGKGGSGGKSLTGNKTVDAILPVVAKAAIAA